MRTLLALAATSLLVLAGCSSSDEPAPEPAPAPTSITPVEPTETPIVLGETFTIAGPNYTANITIDRVYRPEMCDDMPNKYPAIEADVEVTTGDGTSEVLNTGTIRERTPDGYIQKERTVSRVCDGIEELDSMNAQSGDKFRGVIWLQDDVDPQSEILINTPTGGAPISEVFVLDLGETDLESGTSGEAASKPAPSPAAEVTQSIWAPAGQGIQCPGTDARVWDYADCNPSNGIIDPDEFYQLGEQNQQPAHDGVPIADGGTCPAYLCGYGTDEQGNANPTSGELQSQAGCEQGYITDVELCAAVGSPIQ